MVELFEYYDATRSEMKFLPDATFAELRRSLGAVHSVSASDGLMHATLAKLELTHKKRNGSFARPAGIAASRPALKAPNRLCKFGLKA